MSPRDKLSTFLDNPLFNMLILGVILFNAFLMGLETSPAIMARAGGLISTLDTICLVIFVVELVAKLYAEGPRFFRSGWNVFDFVIIENHVSRRARHQPLNVWLGKRGAVLVEDVFVFAIRCDQVQVVHINLIAGHQYRADRWLYAFDQLIDGCKDPVAQLRQRSNACGHAQVAARSDNVGPGLHGFAGTSA